MGMWIQELQTAVLQAELGQDTFKVDVGDLTFADHTGEQVLLALYRMGGQFSGGSAFSDYLCKQMGIEVSGKPAPKNVISPKNNKKNNK